MTSLALCFVVGCSSDSGSGDGSGGTSSGGTASGGTTSGGTGGSGGVAGSSGGASGAATGGTSGSAGSATGGTTSTGGSAGTSGTLTKSAVDECKYSGTSVAACTGTSKPHHWECDTNPSDTPPSAGCEHPANFPKAWCCPAPFCSRYTGADALCGPAYPTKPTGYICADNTPGTSECTQPNVISMPQVYCCP